MYILIVSRGYPSTKYKMNGLFEYDQAKMLAKAKCKVVMLALDLRSIRRWRRWGVETFTRDGVKVYSINIPLGRVPKCLLHGVGRYALLKAYSLIEKKEGTPDIIHAHFIENAYYAALLKSKYNIPLVVTEHSYDMNQETLSPEFRGMAELAYARADKVIAVSNSLKERINGLFNCNSIVIPNVVDISNFKYETTSNTDEVCNIISVGGLIPLKRMDLLIDAFERVFRNDRNIILSIYGEGPEYLYLEKKIKAYNLENNVFLKGLQERSVIAEQMKNCSFFVLASESETFGVAYIEAIAAGIPVIATDCGGPSEFVTPQNGVMIPINDLNALSEALVYMKKNYNRYNKKEISEEISNKYSDTLIAHELLQLYNKAIVHN